jgi:hypothetical protein
MWIYRQFRPLSTLLASKSDFVSNFKVLIVVQFYASVLDNRRQHLHFFSLSESRYRHVWRCFLKGLGVRLRREDYAPLITRNWIAVGPKPENREVAIRKLALMGLECRVL